MLKYTSKAVRKKAMEQKANQKVKEGIYKRRKDIKYDKKISSVTFIDLRRLIKPSEI